MSKILFINGNLHGHINPTLPVVKKLVQRGEEVYYFSAREFQPKLEAAGAVFMDYGDEFYQFIRNFRPHGNHPFYTLMEYMLAFDRTVIPIILSKTEGIRFDCLLHDVMFGGGNILAGKLRLPAIASCSSFVMEKPPLPSRMLEPGFHPQLDYLYGELQAAQKEWQMEKLELSDIFFKRAEKILVYTSRLFQPLGDSFDSTFRFTGPSIMDRAESADFTVDASGIKKLVYISMGTINNNLTDFYTKCFEAFSGNDYQVILLVGNKTDISSLPQPPKNFIVRNYVPQLEVLKQANVFISQIGRAHV
jgi:MGT family glycosyltransferase